MSHAKQALLHTSVVIALAQAEALSAMPCLSAKVV